MGRSSFREQLISSAVETVHQRGFATIGVREITAAAGVAQGSFTNHFASKEAFGAALVDRYAELIQDLLKETLQDSDRPPIARLRAYFDAVLQQLKVREWRHGCLAANMALEAAEHSELIRERLIEYFGVVQSALTKVLREAQQAGQVEASLDARETAAALHEAWHGALLRMKVQRSPVPLKRFLNVTAPALLRLPQSAFGNGLPAKTTARPGTRNGKR